jgi:hypothetical protein
MKSIRTSQNLSFGNGTRRAGFELGKVKDFENAVELASQFEVDFKKIKCELAEDVTASEMITALRNHRFLKFGDPVVETEETLEPKSVVPSDDWRSIAIADVEELNGNDVVLLLANLSVSSEGKFPNIATLGELFDFGDENQGFQVVKGIGEKTDMLLREVLAGHVEPENVDQS